MPGAAQCRRRFKTCLKRNRLVGKCFFFIIIINPLLVYIDLSAFNCNFSFHYKIVDKALEEPKYSQLYGQLCQRLAEDAPNFEDLSTESQTVQKQNSVWLEVIIGFTFQLIVMLSLAIKHISFSFQTFRRLLISKLQDEFENRARNVESMSLSHVTGCKVFHNLYWLYSLMSLLSSLWQKGQPSHLWGRGAAFYCKDQNVG